MSGVIDANILAKFNGTLMENWVKALYPQAVFNYLGAIDCIINGEKCEIKSCQDKIHDSHNSNGSRSGRICLNWDQHKALCNSNGDYILLVHKAGNPFLFYRFPARSVHLPEWNGVKSISWQTFIFGGLLGYEN